MKRKTKDKTIEENKEKKDNFSNDKENTEANRDTSSVSDINEKDNLEILKIKQLELDLYNTREEKLRLLAEMENLRKRLEKEKIDSIKFGNSKLIKDFLSPSDNISRALESLYEEEINHKNYKELVSGIEMVKQEITLILEKNGVKKINALNKKFDHNFHQAMMEIDSDKESGIVLKELQAGYTIHDRLLRPSMVIVSKKTKKTEENSEKN